MTDYLAEKALEDERVIFVNIMKLNLAAVSVVAIIWSII